MNADMLSMLETQLRTTHLARMQPFCLFSLFCLFFPEDSVSLVALTALELAL